MRIYTTALNCSEGLFDRAKGTLVGLAIGDALGATLEFSAIDRLRLHTEMIGGGPFQLEAGEWTDDTAMALALADSLIRHQGFLAKDFMESLLAWALEGRYACQRRCIDIGSTTWAALERYQSTKVPNAGSKKKNTAGNGSLVRLAPTVLFSLGDEQHASTLAKRQSRTTHAAPQALQACAYLAALLHRAIVGHTNLLAPRQLWGHSGLMHVAGGSYLRLSIDDLRPTGYVIDTLEVALWSVAHTETFEQALIKAVSLGGDADSIGAVTGQLAGALYGYSAIPERWLARLAWRCEIERQAEQLIACSTLGGCKDGFTSEG